MSYAAIYDVAVDPAATLRKQTAVAIRMAAGDVANESPSTANHARRFDWANRILGSPSGGVDAAARWIWKVLENTTLQANPTTAADDAVQFVINGLVDTFVNQG